MGMTPHNDHHSVLSSSSSSSLLRQTIILTGARLDLLLPLPMLMLCPLASPSTYVLRTRLVLVLYKFLIYHLLLLRDILS